MMFVRVDAEHRDLGQQVVRKAGEWKTIEQRERAARDARRWRNRGVAAAGVGAAALAEGVRRVDPDTFREIGNEWKHRRVVDAENRYVRPGIFARTKQAASTYNARALKPEGAGMVRALHGGGGLLIAGGLGVAGAGHAVNRFHQAKINQRRRVNAERLSARRGTAAKSSVSKVKEKNKALRDQQLRSQRGIPGSSFNPYRTIRPHYSGIRPRAATRGLETRGARGAPATTFAENLPNHAISSAERGGRPLGVREASVPGNRVGRGLHVAAGTAPDQERAIRDSVRRTGIRGKGKGVVVGVARHRGGFSGSAVPRSGLTGGRGVVALDETVVNRPTVGNYLSRQRPTHIASDVASAAASGKLAPRSAARHMGERARRRNIDSFLAHEVTHATARGNPAKYAEREPRWKMPDLGFSGPSAKERLMAHQNAGEEARAVASTRRRLGRKDVTTSYDPHLKMGRGLKRLGVTPSADIPGWELMRAGARLSHLFKKSGGVRMEQRSNRGEQAVGAALLLAGASRIKGTGKMLDIGTKAKNPLVADLARGGRKVHRYAGSGYDKGERMIRSTRYGSGALDLTGAYTPHATAFVGTGLVAHGRKRETIQGW